MAGVIVLVPDDGAIVASLHVDPDAFEAEQSGDDRVAGLVISDLAAKFAGEIRAQANGGIERFEVTANLAPLGAIQTAGARHEERDFALARNRNRKGVLSIRRRPRGRFPTRIPARISIGSEQASSRGT